MKSKQERLQTLLDKAIDQKKVFGTSFCMKYQGQTWCGASGNLETEQPYFIDSTTKLFVTAVIMWYRAKGLLSLEDTLTKYLEADIVRGLCVYKGKDYSDEITIAQLLAHTSGIPDYFQKKDDKGDSVEKMLMQGVDRKWSFEQAISPLDLLKFRKRFFMFLIESRLHCFMGWSILYIIQQTRSVISMTSSY